MKKHRFQTIGSNAIDPATTTNRKWGFRPVPNKGGATTNAAIMERKKKDEKEETA